MTNIVKVLKELKKYRQSQKISQTDMAKMLQTTQATISRIESGDYLPSKKTLAKIEELLASRKESTGNLDSGEIKMNDIMRQPWNLQGLTRIPQARIKSSDLDKMGLNYSSVVFELHETGGDLCKIKPFSKKKESIFIMVDAFGHGTRATPMSFALEYGFEAVLSSFNEDIISLHLLDSALSLAIKNTKERWRGEPGVIIGTVEHKTGRLSFLNSGLPHPIQRKQKNVKYVDGARYGAINFKNEKLGKKSENNINIRQGDSIIFYTDGVIDLLEKEELFNEFEKASKLFKGDAKAIAKNLQRVIEKKMPDKDTHIEDISYMIISRKNKRMVSS
ncbi:MAG: helix-turn-helix domain-containing protein [Bacteriovoracales bacterium]|nr:helix-turn-helix domain-containing protein [Bacteriovoracales bacterium]